MSSSYWGCYLPSGNFDEPSAIIVACRVRGIAAHYHDTSHGGFIKIGVDDYSKLPRDEKGFYLPIDRDSGHSLTFVAPGNGFYPVIDSKDWREQF
jgi:hypothetical protein